MLGESTVETVESSMHNCFFFLACFGRAYKSLGGHRAFLPFGLGDALGNVKGDKYWPECVNAVVVVLPTLKERGVGGTEGDLFLQTRKRRVIMGKLVLTRAPFIGTTVMRSKGLGGTVCHSRPCFSKLVDSKAV